MDLSRGRALLEVTPFGSRRVLRPHRRLEDLGKFLGLGLCPSPPPPKPSNSSPLRFIGSVNNGVKFFHPLTQHLAEKLGEQEDELNCTNERDRKGEKFFIVSLEMFQELHYLLCLTFDKDMKWTNNISY
ncbi:hypothetical protein E2320_018099 [Naja naja]|nr:hypothetical protein E2320_018099 [Naja naja]